VPSDWYARYRDLVSRRLREVFAPLTHPVYELCAYHMGWRDERGRNAELDAGKMLRPVLCLTACGAYGDANQATGVAAAIELLHAFSLVHDDIEDGDRERRHRPTLWALYGLPLALNAGDALYALAFRTLHETLGLLDRETAALSLQVFGEACLRLVEGQHLDLEFEARPLVSPAEYLAMACGKTGALLGAALGLGALYGGAGSDAVRQLQEGGIELGVAFQARDDALSFWGNSAQIGKAIGNDLIRGKKSLPIVLAADYGLDTEHLSQLTLPEVLEQFERSGVRDAVDQFAASHAGRARNLIAAAGLSQRGGRQLTELLAFATDRES
jgi:geranylgeranyl diphosphate synthase type I